MPKHSVDMLLTDPPYGTTRNFWDVPLPLPELWEAVKWAVKPDGAVLFFAQCPYDKVLGASNLSMLRYEWVWYKSRCTAVSYTHLISPSLGMTPMFMDSLEMLPNCFGETERLCPPNSILHSGTGYCI